MESLLNHRRSAILLAITPLVAFCTPLVAFAQETAPMGHNQSQPVPLVQENKTIKDSDHV